MRSPEFPKGLDLEGHELHLRRIEELRCLSFQLIAEEFEQGRLAKFHRIELQGVVLRILAILVQRMLSRPEWQLEGQLFAQVFENHAVWLATLRSRAEGTPQHPVFPDSERAPVDD